jgi:hypothetical protein
MKPWIFCSFHYALCMYVICMPDRILLGDHEGKENCSNSFSLWNQDQFDDRKNADSLPMIWPWSLLLGTKAMKSSPLLGPFCGSEFWGFSLLKNKIGWVFLCFKLETISSTLLSSWLLSEVWNIKTPNPYLYFEQGKGPPFRQA